ncbi:hypothetical protein METBIDRAFT_31093 [Metschnikowia bicuspidata var. bicuspidata NRRL YB-4993]|uniref:Uncharacterized protein n=1 Tax=Metschnikowia bicuspidata var. bicuspidata NRRL YB-4993 TaxID=869754 RepID=A0A1A0HDI4_9ASCO|nr:hypothetical protein METBIDRAFT_31093 [Metschnikowia bicuspidata var. bicuspidata NRRL YB-4993]OBA22144.1 hypothetical protein METBIDRAFT_31093 [Metschnikowia bicuspidata var. bicuspidata NRRL YB-4993]
MKICSTFALLALISASFALQGYFSIVTESDVQLRISVFLTSINGIIYSSQEKSMYGISDGIVKDKISKAFLTMNENGRLVLGRRDSRFLVDLSKGDQDGYLRHNDNEIFCLKKNDVFVSDSGCQDGLEVRIRFHQE